MTTRGMKYPPGRKTSSESAPLERGVEGETPRLGPMMLVPAKDVEIIDTWFVGGMQGTGSQDFAVHDLFVPTAYTF